MPWIMPVCSRIVHTICVSYNPMMQPLLCLPKSSPDKLLACSYYEKEWRSHHWAGMMQVKNGVQICLELCQCAVILSTLNLFHTGPMMQPLLCLPKSSPDKLLACSYYEKEWRSHHWAAMTQVKNGVQICLELCQCAVILSTLNLFHTGPMMQPLLCLPMSSPDKLLACSYKEKE